MREVRTCGGGLQSLHGSVERKLLKHVVGIPRFFCRRTVVWALHRVFPLTVPLHLGPALPRKFLLCFIFHSPAYSLSDVFAPRSLHGVSRL